MVVPFPAAGYVGGGRLPSMTDDPLLSAGAAGDAEAPLDAEDEAAVKVWGPAQPANLLCGVCGGGGTLASADRQPRGNPGPLAPAPLLCVFS